MTISVLGGDRSATLALLGSVALALVGCSSCSDGDGAAPDGGDTDTDWEFGDTTPCANEARPTEACVPGGNYLMGCVPGDTECEDNEKPLVMVTHSPFFADKNEATIAEVIDWMNAIKDDEDAVVYTDGIGWKAGEGSVSLWVLEWGDVRTVTTIDGEYQFNWAATEDCPAIMGGPEAAAGGFSWLGAKMFCEWKGMVLPTEAQWEAAARGQTFNKFPCGPELNECWAGIYGCCEGGGACETYYDYECSCSAPLPATEADSCLSPFGLTGMYGNADEWTTDWWDGGHQECSGGCVDPQPQSTPPNQNSNHVVKGGSLCSSSQKYLRVSARPSITSDDVARGRGVRCVRPDEPFVVPDAGADGGGAADGKSSIVR
jgi:formylglycine-generating enzyme required for sulfatase activity